MNYLKELNEEQKKAAMHIEGPMLIIAGAGSGKTRVLTFRIAHLIDSGVDPFSIMALTFTNKAAKEMKDRIAKIIGSGEARNIKMGTFHSVFAGILRAESDRLNYPTNFTIYDTADSKSLLRSIIKEMGLDDKVYRTGSVLARISDAKNKLFSPEAYMANYDITADDFASGKPKLGEIYKRYNDRLFRSGAMDFDDLLFNTNVLLSKHADVAYKYCHQFQFILVDEYQDTNYSQYMIVKQLAKVHENLCVVGDDAQSIYGFRGADINNILNFKKDYPDYKLFKLEQNYRSTQNIVKAANSIIAKNKNQIRKEVWTANDSGSRIIVNRLLTDNHEGHHVAQSIHKMVSSGEGDYRDYAVLYRTNAQTRPFEEAFRKINIPYKIYAGTSFYQRKEIKDVIAYFRLSANHHDEESFKRVINYPARGLGKTTLDNLTISGHEYGVSLWEVAMAPDKYRCAITSGAKSKLNEFTTMIRSFATEIDTSDGFKLAHRITNESGIIRGLRELKEPEDQGRLENVEALLAGIQEFTQGSESGDEVKTLSEFLIEVALLTDADNVSGDENAVKMMTIHASKGLEFDTVYIVGMEENLFPAAQSMDTREDLEEERRLFYVAVTRARKHLHLCYATSRFRFGQLTYNEPSRFLEEVDPDYLQTFETKQEERQHFPQPLARQLRPLSATKTTTSANAQNVSGKLTPGMEVLHDRFGKGKVLKLEGKVGEEKATIYFPKEGEKQLLLKFARLEILN